MRSAVFIVLAAGLLAVPVAPMVLGMQPPQPAASDLVDDLVTLEEQLTGVALMPAVEVGADEPWGTVRGDFIGAAFQIDEVDEQLTALVERASDADGPVPRAVRDVASAYRTMREGYRHLEEYEAAGLAVVVQDPGEDGIAVEEARGHAEIGLRLLLEALAGFHEGYGVLRDAEAAADARSLFELRFSEVEGAAQGDGQSARELLSYPTTELMLPVDRFGGPGGAAASPARTVRYACVDRQAYLSQRPTEPVPALPIPEGGQAQLPFPDCPELPEDIGVSVAPPA